MTMVNWHYRTAITVRTQTVLGVCVHLVSMQVVYQDTQ
jgi:hypothetical protein